MRITIKQLRRIIKEEVSRVLVEAIDEKFVKIVDDNRQFLEKICQDYKIYMDEELSVIARDYFTPDEQNKYYDMFGDFGIQGDFGKMTLENLADGLSSEEIHDAYSQENKEGMGASW